ncbi:MAG: NnrU family protein [Burkholderiaceae bacterium]|nr:NnrU family protein [Burkholderiaceae bacterium]
MIVLVVGLLLFLGPHSVRLVADGWRSRRVAAMGEGRWKGLFSLVSIVGLALIVWGYGLARASQGAPLWTPPAWMLHLASPLTLVAFVLIVAAYVPRSRLRALVGHPMLLGVALWALAHLLANGGVADLVLFGAFLAWSAIDFAASRRRDRIAGRQRGGGWGNDLTSVVVGTVAWYAFAVYLHGPLIGVRPFG